MTTNRRKKNSRQRGFTTHGWGSSKKHRGAGSRGGKGRAGTGKRAGQKKAGLKNFRLGRAKGFLPRRNIIADITINVGSLNSRTIERYVQAGWAVKEGSAYAVDLTKGGYGKLLGAGSTDLKLKIKVEKCSAQAQEKVIAAGGEIQSAVESSSE